MRRAWGYIVALALLCSCDAEYEYSDYHCNLRIDNSVHQDATLATAMNALSPGVFCTIRYEATGGGRYVFENNQGLDSYKNFNAIDQQSGNNLRVGMNQALVVGYGNLSSPAVFYAYDMECPNCYNPDALPVKSYRLSISNSGIATCSSCKRTYNLNTGGNLASGDAGTPLTRYRASTTGVFGVLYVN